MRMWDDEMAEMRCEMRFVGIKAKTPRGLGDLERRFPSLWRRAWRLDGLKLATLT